MIEPLRLSLLLLLSAALPAQQKFDASHWAWRAGIDVPGQPDRPNYAAFRLDAGAYRYGSRGFAQLRIAAPGGGEVPFTVRPATPAAAGPARLNPRILNRVVTAQGALQCVLDFGVTGVVHNTLQFDWNEIGFRRAVRIESSGSQAQWDLVRDASLLDFRQDGLIYRTSELVYPDSTQRYLRLTIAGWSNPSTLTSIVSLRSSVARPEWTELAAPPLRSGPPAAGRVKGDAAYEFDLDFPMPSPLRCDLDVEGGEFVREVELLARQNGRHWSPVCQGTIARAAGEGSTSVHCAAPLEGEVRLVVRNRDNPMIAVSRLRLLHPSEAAVFRADAAGAYTVFAGNPAARRPDYDVEAVLSRTPAVKPLAVRLSAWQPNPGYRPPPAPFSERAREWLMPLLALAAIAIGGSAWLLIRKAA